MKETFAKCWFDGVRLHAEAVRVLEQDGFIERIDPMPAQDAPDICLLPGFVNAHAHLELSALAGKLPRNAPFYDWLSAMRKAVSDWTRRDWQDSYLQGLARSYSGGARVVYDVGNQMAEPPEGERMGVRLFALHEVIKQPLPSPATPHSLYATPPRLVAECVERCAEEGVPWSIHLAEHSEDRTLAELLELVGGVRAPGIIVHGNLLSERDLHLVREKNWLIVHCPESCAWFGHAGPDWELWRRSGVKVALGTDSLASAGSLSPLAQARALLARSPHAMAPEEAFAAITSVPGEFLGGGRIAAGERACFLECRIAPHTAPEDALSYILASKSLNSQI
jgi:cytosine/adenosine deaminase-related metal-dependent hydrolase